MNVRIAETQYPLDQLLTLFHHFSPLPKEYFRCPPPSPDPSSRLFL